MKWPVTDCEASSRLSRLSRLAVLLLAAIGGGTTALAAQDLELVTDRPDQTESTAIVPRGYVQLEAGWSLTGDSEGRAHRVAESLLRIGVAAPLEARIGWAGWNRVSAPGVPTFTGYGDIDVGVKYRILSGAPGRPEIAVMGGVTLPIGSQAFRSSRLESSLRLAVAHPLVRRVGIGYNVATTLTSPRSGPGGVRIEDVAYTVAVGVELTGRLGAFLESFGSIGVADGRATQHSVDGGFTLGILPLLQLDVSGGIGLNDAADDWFVGAGFAMLVGG
jgi:hypothetical protein